MIIHHKTAAGLLTDGWNLMGNDCTAMLSGVKITEEVRYSAKWTGNDITGGRIIPAVFGSCFCNVESGGTAR